MTIKIQNLQHKVKVDIPRLEKFAYEVLRCVQAEEYDLGIALVDDKTMRELNNQHNGVYKPTDVLSSSPHVKTNIE